MKPRRFSFPLSAALLQQLHAAHKALKASRGKGVNRAAPELEQLIVTVSGAIAEAQIAEQKLL